MGQAVMIAVSLLLLWLAIRANLNHCCYCQLVSADYCQNIPEAGLAMTALENLLHLGSPEQIAVIAAQLVFHPILLQLKQR